MPLPPGNLLLHQGRQEPLTESNQSPTQETEESGVRLVGGPQGLSEPRQGDASKLGWVVRECFLEEGGYNWALGTEKSVDDQS